MPRPSPEERKRIDANQAAKKRLRDELAERERRIRAKVESITNDALAASKRSSALGMPDINIVNEKLEKAYALAVAKEMPMAMVAAAMAQAKLAGLVIDRSAVLHAEATAEQYSLLGPIDEVRQRMVERLVDENGLTLDRAQRLIANVDRALKGDGAIIVDGD